MSRGCLTRAMCQRLALLLLVAGLYENSGLGAVRAWDYSDNGQLWHEGVCSNTNVKKQSPISLPAAAEEDSSRLLFTFLPVGLALKLYNTGHSLAVTFPDTYKGGIARFETLEALRAGMSNVDAEVYRAAQMTVHSPSEHEFSVGPNHSAKRAMEIQIVHKHPSSSRLAVVALTFEPGGDANPLLDVLLEGGLPQRMWEERWVNRASVAPLTGAAQAAKVHDIYLAPLMNTSAGFLEYEGSQTEPPCDENVIWYVRKDPVLVSSEQLKQFQATLRRAAPPAGNFRAVQPLNGRKVRSLFGQDYYDPTTAHIAPATRTLIVPEPSVTAEDVQNDPTLGELLSSDSQALRKLKEDYNVARQDAESARNAVFSTQQALTTVVSMYDQAPGVVAKIDLKWSVIAAEDTYRASLARREVAIQALAGCTDQMIAYTEMVKTGATTPAPPVVAAVAAPSPAPSSPAPAASAEANVTTPTDYPTVLPPTDDAPAQRLYYSPYAALPSGEGGNPFSKIVAERTARIGAGPLQAARAYRKLAPNLRQPDGPVGVVQPAVLGAAVTTPPPPTQAPTTMPPVVGAAAAAAGAAATGSSLVTQLHLPQDAQAAGGTLSADIVAAVASAVGVPASQIKASPMKQYTAPAVSALRLNSQRRLRSLHPLA